MKKIYFLFILVLLILIIYVLKHLWLKNSRKIHIAKFKVLKRKRGYYKKYLDFDCKNKDDEDIYYYKLNDLDLICVDVDVNSPFWEIYNRFFTKILEKTPYQVKTINNGKHFYFSKSKSFKNGLKIDNCRIACGGIIGLDFITENRVFIPPTQIKTPDGIKKYEWVNKPVDLNNLDELPPLPIKFIEYINYLGKLENNFKSFNKYCGINYLDINNLKKEENESNILTIIWTDEIKECIENRFLNFKKQLFIVGKSFIGFYYKIDNKYVLCINNKFHPDIYINDLLNYFKPKIIINCQKGYSFIMPELGTIKQNNNIYLENGNHFKLNNKFNFVGKSDLIISENNRVFDKNQVLTKCINPHFFKKMAIRKDIDFYSFTVVTDYLGQNPISLLEKGDLNNKLNVFDYFLKNIVFKLLDIMKYVENMI